MLLIDPKADRNLRHEDGKQHIDGVPRHKFGGLCRQHGIKHPIAQSMNNVLTIRMPRIQTELMPFQLNTL